MHALASDATSIFRRQRVGGGGTEGAAVHQHWPEQGSCAAKPNKRPPQDLHRKKFLVVKTERSGLMPLEPLASGSRPSARLREAQAAYSQRGRLVTLHCFSELFPWQSDLAVV